MSPFLHIRNIIGPAADPEILGWYQSRFELGNLFQIHPSDQQTFDMLLEELETETRRGQTAWKVGEVLALLQRRAPRLIPLHHRSHR